MIGVFVMFFKLIETQKQTYDPNQTRLVLSENGQLLELPNWQVNLLFCDNDEIGANGCVQYKSQQSHQMVFPAQSLLAGEDKNSRPNRAIITLPVTTAMRTWLAKQSYVALALPRSVQNSVRFKNTNAIVYGSGVNVTFSISAEDLALEDFVTLDIEFDGYPWFGPAELPPALVAVEHADEYHGLFLKQKNGANLARQIEIGIPLMLAVIALVLDHTLVFGLLSLYAGSSAWRTFLSFQKENVNQAAFLDSYLNIFVNGLNLVLLVYFVMQILEISLKKIHHFALLSLFFGFTILMLMANKFYVDRSILTLSADNLADSISCFIGSLLALRGIYFCLKIRKKNEQSWQEIPLKILRNSIILVAVVTHCYINIGDLIQVTTSQFKNMLDWKHALLLPSFTTAALLEVGSTSKKMLSYGKEMAKKTAYEKDLAIGQEVQQRMLPSLRGHMFQASWRSIYKPAQALSGDWFDIRAITFADEKQILVACVADVTGHGVGSSLTTSVISSHWGVWCSELAMQSHMPDITSREQALCKAALMINNGLQALRHNELCTAIFLLVDPKEGWATLLSAAHPGIIVEHNNAIEYFTTTGARLGANDSALVSWQAKSVQLRSKSNIYLFSDGIQPPGTGLSRWISMLKRKVTGKSALVEMAKQVQRNKKTFAVNELEADDQTLLAISIDTVANS